MDPTDINQHGAWFNTTEAAPDDDFVEFGVRSSRSRRLVIGVLTLVSFLIPGAAGIWLSLKSAAIATLIP